MTFGELDHVAKAVAYRSDSFYRDCRGVLDFDDIYQSIWVKFLRYKPRYITMAWRMARFARKDVLEKERTKVRLREKIMAYAVSELRSNVG